MRLLSIIVAICLSFGFIQADACAQEQPAQQVALVFDQAELLTPPQEAEIRGNCEQLMDEAAVPMVVATVVTIGDRRIHGNDIDSVAQRLLDVFRPDADRDESVVQAWQSSALLLVSRSDAVGTIFLNEDWDRRDREKVRQVVLNDLNPLLRRGEAYRAISTSLQQMKEIAANRRERVDSYWSYFVQIEWREWKNQLSAIEKLFTKPDIRDPLASIGLILLVFFVWEWVRPWRKSQRRFREGLGLDLFYTVFSYVIFWALFGTALCTVTARAFDDFLYHFFGVENLVAVRLTTVPIWLRYVLLVLAIEFTNYWIHRLLHRFDWAWEFHKIHHSARRVDVMNAARLHFGERLIYQFFAYVPLSMIGFEVSDVFYVGLFINIFSNFTHANVSVPLGPLKYIVNSPQMHIWHHAAEYHERGNVNFGDALIIWDFVFGTAYLHDPKVDTAKMKLGFDDIETYPQTFIAQTILPFKNIVSGAVKRLKSWMPS